MGAQYISETGVLHALKRFVEHEAWLDYINIYSLDYLENDVLIGQKSKTSTVCRSYIK